MGGSTPERLRDAWRLPASEIERTVAAAAHQLLRNEPAIATAVEEAGVTPSHILSVLEATRTWDRKLQSEAEVGTALTALVHRVELGRDGLRQFPGRRAERLPGQILTLVVHNRSHRPGSWCPWCHAGIPG